MTMKKTGDAEKVELVYTGRQASVVRDHLLKTGKALSDFDKDEKAKLERDLKDAEKEEENSE